MFDGLIASKLLNVEKFSSLSRLVRATAWVRRVVKKCLKIRTKTSGSSKWEVKSLERIFKEAILTVSEQEDALEDLFLAAQENIVFTDTTLSRLAVYRYEISGLLVCGGRIKIFNEDKTAVPILPYNAYVSTPEMGTRVTDSDSSHIFIDFRHDSDSN